MYIHITSNMQNHYCTYIHTYSDNIIIKPFMSCIMKMAHVAMSHGYYKTQNKNTEFSFKHTDISH